MKIADRPLGADAVVVVIEKSQHCQAERNEGLGGGRLEARQQTDAVTERDEDEQHRDEGYMRLIAVADNRVALRVAELQEHLRNALHRIGALDVEGEPHHDEEREQHEGNHQLQGKNVGDGRAGGLRMNANGRQQGGQRAAEERVQ